MKKLVYMLMITFFFSSCSKEDWEKDCKSDCTILSGRFVSLNNEPVPNVNIYLTYRISGGFIGNGSSRSIVKTKSDKNGYFKKSFYVKDSELGNAKGYFDFTIDDSPLDILKYIRQDNHNGGGNIINTSIRSIDKRNIIINNTYYIPKKKFIKVNLNNFTPQLKGDFFNVGSLYPFGSFVGSNTYLNSQYTTGSSRPFDATQLNNTLTIFAAEGENNVIRVGRRKNGITSYEDVKMVIPGDNSIELTYVY